MLQQQQAGPVRPVQVVEDHDQACLPRRTSREGGHGVEQSERAVSGSREGGGSSSGTHLGHLRTRALPRPRSSDPTPPAPREPGPGPGPRAARRCGSCRCRARPPPAPAGLARPGCPPVRRRAGRAQAGGPTNTLSTCASVVGASGMGRRPMSGCSSANTCSSRDRPSSGARRHRSARPRPAAHRPPRRPSPATAGPDLLGRATAAGPPGSGSARSSRRRVAPPRRCAAPRGWEGRRIRPRFSQKCFLERQCGRHPHICRSERRQRRAGGARRMLGPRWGRGRPWKGLRRRLRSGGRSWSTVGATLRFPGLDDLHAWRLIVLARGPAPVARGSAG
jgi:hypothetical protein